MQIPGKNDIFTTFGKQKWNVRNYKVSCTFPLFVFFDSLIFYTVCRQRQIYISLPREKKFIQIQNVQSYRKKIFLECFLFYL